uniref:C2 domain-containing protein n=1 Tax=Seriola dumerili TaxID=41447 RepID=A0A3B4VHY8_SERDU
MTSVLLIDQTVKPLVLSPLHFTPCPFSSCPALFLCMARVIITVQRASGLWGDWFTSADGYVKVFINKQLWRSPVIYNNNNPHWAMVIDVGSHDVSSGQKVRFEVWDEDNKWDDDLLGACERVLSTGVKQDFCNLNNGNLLSRHYKLFIAVSVSNSMA